MIGMVLSIAYLYGLLPFLMGIAIFLLSKRRMRLSQMYVSGYSLYFALFEIIVAWETHRHASYTRFARYWEISIYILTIIVLFYISFSIIKIKKNHGSYLQEFSFSSAFHDKKHYGLRRSNGIIIGSTVFLVLLSVLFLVPQAFDQTPELARLSLSNDTFFSLDPTTGLSYTDSSAFPGCLHLFYAFGSTITGINVTTLIHLIMPFFMIPLFVCTYVIIANILFPDEEKSGKADLSG